MIRYPGLDPDARRVLEMIRLANRPPYETLTAAEARALQVASMPILQPPAAEVAQVRAVDADGIACRLYRPLGSAAGAMLPGLVFLHGGGWMIGSLDTYDVVCRRLANDAGVAVVTVDYRLAPEHRYPAAVEDAVAATRWVAREAHSLGIDPTRLAVGGDSAGGNLAAVLALMARDRALPPIAFQLLVYPATDMTMQMPSYQRFVTDFPLTAATARWFRDAYSPDPVRWTEWQASPLRAASLAGTAPAFVLTAGHDPLVDEGRAYACRLEQEGVRTTLMHMADQMHGFITMGRVVRAADTALLHCAAALRAALSG
ncbi:MAG: alpha/beta hydrolase [Rhodospirillales bacterium]|nr:alpha/beta hydrolase [Rhodospirillales bacterium]